MFGFGIIEVITSILPIIFIGIAIIFIQKMMSRTSNENYLSTSVSGKSRTVSLLLCFLFGWAGGHRFYVNKTGTGILMLLTMGGFGLWYFVDLILILSGNFRDHNGVYVRSWGGGSFNYKEHYSLYGGYISDPGKSHVTRYLSASAFLQGWSFRKNVLEYVKEKHKAMAPELGHDVVFLSKVCDLADKEDFKYQIAFFALSIVAILVIIFFSKNSEAVKVIAILFLVAAAAIHFIREMSLNKFIMNRFSIKKYDPDRITRTLLNHSDISIPQSLLESNSKQKHNMIVYSGFTPFVGAGTNLDGWSFVVDISKPDMEKAEDNKNDIVSFNIHELYTAIDRSLMGLEIPGLKIEDCLFTNGISIRDDNRILPALHAKPLSYVDDSFIKEHSERHDALIRYYKWIKIFDWGNELVVSYFVRLSRQGKKMFIEVNRFLLLPLEEKFRKVDTLTDMDWRDYISLGAFSIAMSPLSVINAWLSLANRVNMGISEKFFSPEKSIKKLIEENQFFNFGVESSLREKFSLSSRYLHYFQKLDKEKYFKTVERELLDAIVNFLEEHNIDTSELSERKANIINNGIIVKGGGDVKAESIAVGQGAMTTISKTFLNKGVK